MFTYTSSAITAELFAVEVLRELRLPIKDGCQILGRWPNLSSSFLHTIRHVPGRFYVDRLEKGFTGIALIWIDDDPNDDTDAYLVLESTRCSPEFSKRLPEILAWDASDLFRALLSVVSQLTRERLLAGAAKSPSAAAK
jgi:hypothetical protein